LNSQSEEEPGFLTIDIKWKMCCFGVENICMGGGKAVCDPSQDTSPDGVELVQCTGFGYKYFGAIKEGGENDFLGEPTGVVRHEACAWVR
jgi:hypothetical protein